MLFSGGGNCDSHFTKSCIIFHYPHFSRDDKIFGLSIGAFTILLHSFGLMNDLSFLEKIILIHVLDNYGDMRERVAILMFLKCLYDTKRASLVGSMASDCLTFSIWFEFARVLLRTCLNVG